MLLACTIDLPSKHEQSDWSIVRYIVPSTYYPRSEGMGMVQAARLCSKYQDHYNYYYIVFRSPIEPLVVYSLDSGQHNQDHSDFIGLGV